MSNASSPTGQMMGIELDCGLDWAHRPFLFPHAGSSPHATQGLDWPRVLLAVCSLALDLHVAFSTCHVWYPHQTSHALDLASRTGLGPNPDWPQFQRIGQIQREYQLGLCVLNAACIDCSLTQHTRLVWSIHCMCHSHQIIPIQWIWHIQHNCGLIWPQIQILTGSVQREQAPQTSPVPSAAYARQAVHTARSKWDQYWCVLHAVGSTVGHLFTPCFREKCRSPIVGICETIHHPRRAW